MQRPSPMLWPLLLSLGCGETSVPAPVPDAAPPDAAGPSGPTDTAAAPPSDSAPPPDVAPARDLPPASDALAPSACTGPETAPLRRLTTTQYQRSVRELTGVTVTTSFPLDGARDGFDDRVEVQSVSPLLVGTWSDAAQEIVGALAPRLGEVTGCAAPIDDACARGFIASFGRRAFRRPLTDAEAAAHFTLFNQARMLGDASDGIAAVLAAMLQSPHFLYRPELGGKLSGGQVTLTPWEVASRLSYFLWGSMPDAALFSAAETNQLGSAQQVGLQVQRMLTDSRARQGTNDFFRQWLGIDQVLNVTKDQAVYPAWNDGLAVAMREEGYRFTQHVVFDADGRLGSLFTSTEGIVNGPLAQLYGVAITGSDWQPVSTAGLNRMGILTQGWFLAGRARPGESSPARRGAFVRERLFCQQVPPPPANVDPAPPPPLPGSTTRERYQQQLVNPACAACHQFFDGFGFAFEHYDGIGAFRAADNGKPIDSTGRIDATDVDGTVADAPDLIKRLSESGQVRDCVATRWYELAVGRQVDEMNDCRVREVTRLFRGGQGNLRELLLLIATDYARRPRLAGEVASPLGAPLISNPNDRRSVQKMVLDLISTQIVQLRQRLSLPDDRLRLDQHLDGLRELEKRLQ